MHSRRLRLSAIAVVVALGSLALAALAHARAGHPRAAGRPRSSEAASSDAATSSPPSGPPGAITVVSDVQWMSFHGVLVPVSASAGPRQNPPVGAPSGFADTPTGAVMAAVHIALRLDDRFGPQVFQPTVQQRVTGPDAAAALASLQQQYEQDRIRADVPDGEATGPVYVILAGFRIDGFTPAAAVVHLLAEGPADGSSGAGYADYRVELRWIDGDWWMLAPPGGSWDSLVTIATSARGYTRFGG